MELSKNIYWTDIWLIPEHGDMRTLTIADTVTIADVRSAADRIAGHLPATPAWEYPALSRRAGCEVVVKHENVQPTGAFKVRGGLSLLSAMQSTPEGAAQLRRGLVTTSTGNHAQGLAYAARALGCEATIVMPTSAPQVKREAVELLGARVIDHGDTMSESTIRAKELAESTGGRYVDPGSTPEIIAGHATVYLELFAQYPDLEAVYVPVGSGSGAAGARIVRDALSPKCRIYAVQSRQAPAAYESWRSASLVTAPNRTRHSGLATGAGSALPQRILCDGLADFILVEDDEIDSAARILALTAHTLAEGAGAAALAGLLRHLNRDQRCAVVCTGGNASVAELVTLGTSRHE